MPDQVDVTDFRCIHFFIFTSGAGFRLLRFFFLKRIIIRVVSLREQLLQILRRLAGNILYGNTLADVGGVARTALRGINVQIPDELVVDTRPSEQTNVRWHLRTLADGWHHSAAKKAEADAMGIVLPPNQTIVDSYSKNVA